MKERLTMKFHLQLLCFIGLLNVYSSCDILAVLNKITCDGIKTIYEDTKLQDLYCGCVHAAIYADVSTCDFENFNLDGAPSCEKAIKDKRMKTVIKKDGLKNHKTALSMTLSLKGLSMNDLCNAISRDGPKIMEATEKQFKTPNSTLKAYLENCDKNDLEKCLKNSYNVYVKTLGKVNPQTKKFMNLAFKNAVNKKDSGFLGEMVDMILGKNKFSAEIKECIQDLPNAATKKLQEYNITILEDYKVKL